MGIFSNKPKAVDHDAGSTAWEGVKGAGVGAAKWVLGPTLIAGLATAVAAVIVSASPLALFGVLAVGGIATIGTGVASGFLAAPLAAIGAFLGVNKAGKKVTAESVEFQRQKHHNAQARHNQRARDYNNGYTHGQEDTYPVGLQDGAAMAQEHMLRTAHGGASASASATANCDCTPKPVVGTGEHTGPLREKRIVNAAVAAAGATVTAPGG